MPEVLANLLLLREALCSEENRFYWNAAIGSTNREALWSSTAARGLAGLGVSPEELLDWVSDG